MERNRFIIGDTFTADSQIIMMEEQNNRWDLSAFMFLRADSKSVKGISKDGLM